MYIMGGVSNEEVIDHKKEKQALKCMLLYTEKTRSIKNEEETTSSLSVLDMLLYIQLYMYKLIINNQFIIMYSVYISTMYLLII